MNKATEDSGGETAFHYQNFKLAPRTEPFKWFIKMEKTPLREICIGQKGDQRPPRSPKMYIFYRKAEEN